MMPCKACSIGKAQQLAIDKHVDNSKKATKYLGTIKALQDSGVKTINRNWHIVMNQHTGYKAVPRVTLWNQSARNLAKGKKMGNQ